MTTPYVCDASALVALLVDGGRAGKWAADTLTGADLHAPHVVDFEVANVLRRHELGKVISPDQAAQAHADLLDLAIERWSYEALAPSAWPMRANVTVYDAAYLALAEVIGAALVTLDRRLRRVPGVRCTVLSP